MREKKNPKLILSVFEFFHAPLYATILLHCLLNIRFDVETFTIVEKCVRSSKKSNSGSGSSRSSSIIIIMTRMIFFCRCRYCWLDLLCSSHSLSLCPHPRSRIKHPLLIQTFSTNFHLKFRYIILLI